MSEPTSITCPHCGAANRAGAAFCASCGNALPTLNSTGPRIITGNAFASTEAGQKLQVDELARQARRASGIFTFVGAIVLAFGLMLFMQLQNLPASRQFPLWKMLSAVQIVFGGLLLCAGLWARRDPLPATITGLVLYIAMTIAYIAVYWSAGRLQNITSLLFIRLVIVIVLCRAVGAGIRHRRLLRQLNQPTPFANIAPPR